MSTSLLLPLLLLQYSYLRFGQHNPELRVAQYIGQVIDRKGLCGKADIVAAYIQSINKTQNQSSK